MISNKLMKLNKHILTHAYCWRPYEKIDIKTIQSINSIIREPKEQNYECNLSFKHTGLLSKNTQLFYNAHLYVNSNIQIIEKFLNNKDNERIKQVFENKLWESDAILIKNKFHEIERSCIKLYDMFLFID
jgi:hypothetical protein